MGIEGRHKAAVFGWRYGIQERLAEPTRREPIVRRLILNADASQASAVTEPWYRPLLHWLRECGIGVASIFLAFFSWLASRKLGFGADAADADAAGTDADADEDADTRAGDAGSLKRDATDPPDFEFAQSSPSPQEDGCSKPQAAVRQPETAVRQLYKRLALYFHPDKQGKDSLLEKWQASTYMILIKDIYGGYQESLKTDDHYGAQQQVQQLRSIEGVMNQLNDLIVVRIEQARLAQEEAAGLERIRLACARLEQKVGCLEREATSRRLRFLSPQQQQPPSAQQLTLRCRFLPGGVDEQSGDEHARGIKRRATSSTTNSTLPL